MGVETAQTHAIFFIAAVVVAAGVVGIFNQSIGGFTGQLKDRSNHLSDELATDIRIVNDPANMPNSPLTFYVLNTGSAPILLVDVIVLVNGIAYTTLALDVLATTEEVLRTGQVLQIQVTGLNLSSGDHQARVIVAHGVADNLRFTI